MSAHTKGPWLLKGCGGAPWIEAASGKAVALVVLRDVNENAEVKANGHLMLAAPDLLDALKAVALAEAPRECDCGGAVCEMWKAARAAIAKAEGKC